MGSQAHNHSHAADERDDWEYGMSSNAAWAGYKHHQNPGFFSKLASGQSPKILWLGCSDSRVPETTILGLQPGDVFVHRNIANVISPTDINTSAVIEYAVVHLKVKHVVLCGHTACGGANAALGDAKVGGVLDTWLTPVKKLRKEFQRELDSIADTGDKIRRLAELNVEGGVETLFANSVVDEAIRERGLFVHGVLYDIASGRLVDLNVGNGKGQVGKGELSGKLGNGQQADSRKHKPLSSNKFAEERTEVRGNHGMLVFGNSGANMAIR